MDALRRSLIKNGTTAAALLPLLTAGLLWPRRVLAAAWNHQAFTARSVGDALRAYGAGSAAETRDILINAPEIAENGAKVEIEVSSSLPETRSLALFAEKNPMPLCASMDFGANMLPYVRFQVKLAESTRLRAVATAADGRKYVASREVKVTTGGCGG